MTAKISSFLRMAAAIALFCCDHQHANGQQAQSDSITRKFDRYRKGTPQEKIFVHIDQPFYLIGETAWFRIYCTDASLHKPVDLSKVAYVELLDRTNTAVLQTKVELEKGAGKGSVFLPASLPSGNYTFRCYTSWMKNFQPDFFFHQTITVVNPFVKAELSKKANEPNPTVDFFPEGGFLVDGMRSRVGFKVTDSSGKGITASGALVNASNDTLVRFTPLKFGLGSFLVTPVAGERYRAVIRFGGKTFQANFPQSRAEGYCMRLRDDGSSLRIVVTKRTTDAQRGQFVSLFSHARNTTLSVETKFFKADSCEFLVDKNKLADGVTHFTVFDEQQLPVTERLFFKRPASPFSLSATTDAGQYGMRKKVNLALKTTGSSASDVSISVYRLDTLSKNETNDVYSYLWLSSDLTGAIESPGFYFTDDAIAREAADHLMLTHGWRRFKWDHVFSAGPVAHLPEVRGHLITGKLSHRTDSAAKGILTYLSVPGNRVQLYVSRSDEQGKVVFEVTNLKGQNKLVFQKAPGHTDVTSMEIVSPFSTAYSKHIPPLFNISSVPKREFESRAVAMQVQDIYYEETSATPTMQKTDSSAFYGKADETYFLDSYTRFPVMEEVMREYVPGVFVRKRKEGFHFIVVDVVNGGVLHGDPMILLDGVPLFDADKIMQVDPRLIRKLEVVTRPYYLGPLFMPGIVSYTSYNGDMAGLEISPGNVSINYDGLQAYREFHVPRYETQRQFDSRVPDRRYLLYWNPQVKIPAGGTANLQFPTSDVKGRFVIVVHGLSANGHAATAQHVFSVR